MAVALTHTAQRIFDGLEPLAFDDEQQGDALAHFCAAFALLVEPLADVVRDTDDGQVGWSQVMHPDTAPVEWLPWLAQFVGVRLPTGFSEELLRDRVRTPTGFGRGTVAAIVAAAREHLTGAQTVLLFERFGGSAYALQVTTFESETPDEAAVEAAVRRQKPGGIVLTYDAVPGGNWDTLAGTHADWAEVALDFTDWADVASDPSQT